MLYGGQQSTVIYTSVGGRSRKNSAPTGSGGGGEVITGNKVLKPVAWDQLGSAWILAQYAPTTPFTCTDVGTGNPCIWISSHSLPQRLQCSGHCEFSLSNARFITHHISVQLFWTQFVSVPYYFLSPSHQKGSRRFRLELWKEVFVDVIIILERRRGRENCRAEPNNCAAKPGNSA